MISSPSTSESTMYVSRIEKSRPAWRVVTFLIYCRIHLYVAERQKNLIPAPSNYTIFWSPHLMYSGLKALFQFFPCSTYFHLLNLANRHSTELGKNRNHLAITYGGINDGFPFENHLIPLTVTYNRVHHRVIAPIRESRMNMTDIHYSRGSCCTWRKEVRHTYHRHGELPATWKCFFEIYSL